MVFGAPIHLRVFLSSPGDVAEERRIARDVIGAIAGRPLLKGRVSFEVVAYDDPNAPAPMSATETPQASVNRYSGRPADCDLTIVILWSKVGTPLPPSITREDGTCYESGTVWELDDASRAKKEVWIYRRTEEPVVGLKDPEYEKKRAALKAVDDFFQEFTQSDGSLTSGFNKYSTVADFGKLIEQHLEAFVRMRLESAPGRADTTALLQVSSSASGPNWNWPEPWDFRPFLESKRKGFVGREWLFREVDEWLGCDGAQALLIEADYGVGKSAFAAELVQRNPRGAIVGLHCCQHDTHDTLDPALFTISIAAQLAKIFPPFRQFIDADPALQAALDKAGDDAASAFERAVVGPLTKLPAPQDGSKCIVVDALDESLEFSGAQERQRAKHIVELLAGRASRLPKWLRILATTRKRSGVLTPMRASFESKVVDAEDQRNLTDLSEYIRGRAASAGLSQKLEQAKMPVAGLVDALREKSKGKFLYAVRALDDLERGRLAVSDMPALPTGMDAFYLDAFQRRFERADREYEPTRAVFGVIAAAQEPISRADIARILNASEADLQAAIGAVGDFLSARGKRYAFDHFSLAQWLTEEDDEGEWRAGAYHVDLEEGGQRFVRWIETAVEQGRSHESEYLLRHLAAHVGPAQRREIYVRLLTDFRWLMRKLEVTGIHALLAEFVHIADDRERSAIDLALRQAAHVLARRENTDQLATQLLGRLLHRKEPALAQFCERVIADMRPRQWLRPLSASLRAPGALVATLVDGGEVNALALLPDGRVASGSKDTTIKLWNLKTGEVETTLEGHSGTVHAFALLSDGRLASGSWDETIKLWNLKTGEVETTLEGHSGSVSALVLLPDGRLASGSNDTTIKLWNLKTGKAESTLEGHSHWVKALALLPDGRLASGSWDDTIKLWNLKTGKAETTLEGHSSSVNALALLPDGRLASSAYDATIKLWNLRTGKAETTLEGHSSSVNALALLPDGRLASGSNDTTIKLWNLKNGKAEPTLEGHSRWVNALALLPDGRLASGADDDTIKLWNLKTGKAEPTLEGHSSSVNALALLPDGRLASGSWDQTIKLWNLKTGELETTLKGHSGRVSALALLPNGRLGSGSWDQTIKVWNLKTGEVETTLEGHSGSVNVLALLTDGRLASGADDNTIKLWNLKTGKAETTLEGHSSWVNALALLPDGRLASGADDDTIKLWNLKTGKAETTLEGHSSSVHVLALLSDDRLASGADDKTVKLWNLKTGEVETTLEGHSAGVNALALLPDGRLASGSYDNTVRLWNTCCSSAPAIASFVADAPIRCLVSADGKMIIAGDEAGRLHFLMLEGPD